MLTEPPDITLRLLESAANDPEAELLFEARDEIVQLREHIREQAAELERVREKIDTKPRHDDMPTTLILPSGTEIEDACKLIGDDPENWESTGRSVPRLGVEYRRKASP